MKGKGNVQLTPQIQGENKPPTGFDMDAMVGTILLVGVLVSMGLIIIGLIWNWIANGTITFVYSIEGENFFGFLLHSFSQLFGNSGIQPRQFISLGIVTLMLTPFIRVLASFIYFVFADRDWKFSLITLIVLGVLTYSLFLR